VAWNAVISGRGQELGGAQESGGAQGVRGGTGDRGANETGGAQGESGGVLVAGSLVSEGESERGTGGLERCQLRGAQGESGAAQELGGAHVTWEAGQAGEGQPRGAEGLSELRELVKALEGCFAETVSGVANARLKAHLHASSSCGEPPCKDASLHAVHTFRTTNRACSRLTPPVTPPPSVQWSG